MPVTDKADQYFFGALTWRINDALRASSDAAIRHFSVDDLLPVRRGLAEGETDLTAVAFMLGPKADRFTAVLRFAPAAAKAFRAGQRSLSFADDDPSIWLAFDVKRKHLVVTVHR